MTFDLDREILWSVPFLYMRDGKRGETGRNTHGESEDERLLAFVLYHGGLDERRTRERGRALHLVRDDMGVERGMGMRRKEGLARVLGDMMVMVVMVVMIWVIIRRRRRSRRGPAMRRRRRLAWWWWWWWWDKRVQGIRGHGEEVDTTHQTQGLAISELKGVLPCPRERRESSRIVGYLFLVLGLGAVAMYLVQPQMDDGRWIERSSVYPRIPSTSVVVVERERGRGRGRTFFPDQLSGSL